MAYYYSKRPAKGHTFCKGGLVYCITALKIRGLLVIGAWSRFGLFMLIMFQYQRIPNIR